mgnify:CR=1 FL=1
MWRLEQVAKRDYEGDLTQKSITFRNCILLDKPFKSKFNKITLQRLHIDHGGFVMEELAKAQLGLIDAWGHAPFDGFDPNKITPFRRTRNTYLKSAQYLKLKGLFGPGENNTTVEIKSCLSKGYDNTGWGDRFAFAKHQVAYANRFDGLTIGVRFLTNSRTMLQMYICPAEVI